MRVNWEGRGKKRAHGPVINKAIMKGMQLKSFRYDNSDICNNFSVGFTVNINKSNKSIECVSTDINKIKDMD